MKRIGTLLCGVAVMLIMTGCGATVPDLTEEETAIISQYAADVLLKYDKNHGSRLVELPEETVEEVAETEETPAAEETQPEASDDVTVVDKTKEAEETAETTTIESYYGISDFTFQYTGYEIVNSYPDMEEEGDVFFSMDATEGTQLLVLKFQATNQTGTEQMLSMLSYGARFRISVNGESSKGALATMLLNDMQTCEQTVEPGSSIELVSIIEIPVDTGIDSIDLILRGGEQDAAMKLQ